MSEKENIPTINFIPMGAITYCGVEVVKASLDLTGKYPNTNKGRIGFSRQVYNGPQGAKFV